MQSITEVFEQHYWKRVWLNQFWQQWGQVGISILHKGVSLTAGLRAWICPSVCYQGDCVDKCHLSIICCDHLYEQFKNNWLLRDFTTSENFLSPWSAVATQLQKNSAEHQIRTGLWSQPSWFKYKLCLNNQFSVLTT